MKACIFIAAGDISEEYFEGLMKLEPRPFIFAVDGGYKYLRERNVEPELALGDFDSLGFVPKNTEIVRHPVHKDETDMILAIDEAVKRGFDTAFVLGALGGARPDHAYANMQSLFYALPALKLIYLDDKAVCFAVQDGELRVEGASVAVYGNASPDTPAFELPTVLEKHLAVRDRYLSLFAKDAATVDISGCIYNGAGLSLTNSFPLGVSNEITEEEAVVKCRGNVLIMISGKRDHE